MAIKDVKVTITLLKPVGSAGFGYPLLLTKGETEVPYTVCNGLDEVVKAGFANDTDMYKAANLVFMQNDAPSKIAVCSTTKDYATFLPEIIDKEWRQLVIVDTTLTDYDTAVSTYIETTGKICFIGAKTAPTESKNYKAFDRTVCVVYTDTLGVAAVVGATAGLETGSFTYKNIVIKGLTAQDYTEADITAMHKNGAITVLEKAGDIVTSEGIVGSGEYIDIIDSKDWIIQQLEYQTQQLLNNMKKIPYDNNGIAMLEGVAVNVMRTAYGMGMIADNEDGSPAYTVNYALKSECAEGDIAARKYVGGKFAFTLAGAIHNVEIDGEISVA